MVKATEKKDPKVADLEESYQLELREHLVKLQDQQVEGGRELPRHLLTVVGFLGTSGFIALGSLRPMPGDSLPYLTGSAIAFILALLGPIIAMHGGIHMRSGDEEQLRRFLLGEYTQSEYFSTVESSKNRWLSKVINLSLLIGSICTIVAIVCYMAGISKALQLEATQMSTKRDIKTGSPSPKPPPPPPQKPNGGSDTTKK